MNIVPASNRPAPKTIENQMTGMELIAALLDRGANPNARLKKQQPYRTKVDRGNDTMLGAGTTPFLRAARAGDAAAMRLLLKRGADPKIATGSDVPVDVSQPVRRQPGGINPLMAAAGLGSKEEDSVGRYKTDAQSIEAVQVCLEAGVDINAVDGRGQTALYGAALQGYDEVVKFLLSKGAKTDIKDQRGFTALDAAEGKAGGFGFGGGTANPHPTTAKILETQRRTDRSNSVLLSPRPSWLPTTIHIDCRSKELFGSDRTRFVQSQRRRRVRSREEEIPHAPPRACEPQQRDDEAGDDGMAAEQRPSGRARQQQRHQPQRDRQVTRAESERPNHPQQSSVLRLSRRQRDRTRGAFVRHRRPAFRPPPRRDGNADSSW